MAPFRHAFGRSSEVSLFTLGTMRAICSIEQMTTVLRGAFDVGINHIETAPVYGPAESFLGKSLQKLTRQGIVPDGGWVITSKLLPGLSYYDGKKAISAILERLGKSHIDNLAIHGINRKEHLKWALTGEGSDLLRWAEETGLVSQVGFSSHGSHELIQETLDSERFQFCSLHLHLFDQQRIPLAKRALAKGIGVMAISPADKGGHLHTPSSILVDDCRPFTPLEIAYRFLLSTGISTLTIGASKIEDLKLPKKLINADGPLDLEEITVLNRLKNRCFLRLGETFCGQCRRCIPCPQDVPIPEVLRLRNLAVGYDMQVFAKERYNLIGKAGHWWEEVDASACMDCGKCIPLCPNDLNIPQLLEDTHRRLMSSPSRRLWG